MVALAWFCSSIRRTHKKIAAFTLIEIAIVLVIIGLIVGGVLVGQDLISSATARAQITQIDKFKQGSNTFMVKYGYLPGDIPYADIQKFGFNTLASNGIQLGNANGMLDRNTGWFGYADTESSTFWLQLSEARLSEFSPLVHPFYANADVTGSSIASYIPLGKLSNTHVYAWSGGVNAHIGIGLANPDGKTYLSVALFTRWCGTNVCVGPTYSNNVQVRIAQSIDRKMDDGLPQSGSVTASLFNWAGVSDAVYNTEVSGNDYFPTTTATAGSSSTCYDNNNISGAAQQYSITQNNGAGSNCALSFRLN